MGYRTGNKMIFSSQNSIQETATPPITNLCIGHLDESNTKAFRDSLKTVLEMQSQLEHLKNAINDLQKDLFKAADNHRSVCEHIHDIMGKKMAIQGYNEFRQKLHVNSDGTVLLVPMNEDISKEVSR
jgi:hypothetical protein